VLERAGGGNPVADLRLPDWSFFVGSAASAPASIDRNASMIARSKASSIAI
jgi:hypothetical protein